MAGARVSRRWLQPQAGVGPVVVVVLAPRSERDARLRERGKPMTRETLTSYAAVEGLTDTVVDRFPRKVEVEVDPIPVRPVIQRGGRELRPVVHPEAR